MSDSGVELQSSRQTMGISTFQETAQIVIIETATEHVSYVRLAARGKSVFVLAA